MLKSGIFVLIALIHASAASEGCSIGEYVFRGSASFHAAVATCAMSQLSNQLLTPKMKEEMDFITVHTNNFETDFWVGIHRAIDGENFITLRDENFRENEYFKWDVDEPHNGTGYDCVAVNQNGLLSTRQCSNTLPSFCKIMSFGRRWFNPRTAPDNFNDAVTNCALEGAQLLTHTTRTELDHLIEFVKIADEPYWLGIHDLFTEGNFINIDGDPVEDLGIDLPWEEGRPQSDTDRNCVQLSPDGTIVDVPCIGSFKYFCVK